MSDATPPGAETLPLRRGTEITIRAETAAFEGGCVGRFDGLAVFLEGCVPGDLVRARVFRTRRRHVEARALEILEPSQHRVVPECIHFADCGGCTWQNLEYAQQLHWKRQHVIDSLQRIGGLAGLDVPETIPCDNRLFYRNKMEFSFGDSRWLTDADMTSGENLKRDFALGLHVPGRYDKVLDVSDCRLQSMLSNRIIATTRQFALDEGLVPYSTRTHTGILRHLVIRQSVATGETMVVLVTADSIDDEIARYVVKLRNDVPEVTTIVQGIHRGKAQVTFTQDLRILHGAGTITERIAGNDFTISPFSFFQTNTRQAELLYERALQAGALTGEEKVWDLYCGAGTITLAAARRSAVVLGAEINEASVADARANAARNRVSNVEFVAGDLRTTIDEAERHFVPDVVITDPPRAGMHENVVRALLRLRPERICYVSCNPTTQARDLAILSEAYRVDRVQPVDMFPQTYHVETVAGLTRID